MEFVSNMVTIILKADIPVTDLQGLKEAAAMALEGLGDFRVVSVTAEAPEQFKFDI